MIDYSIVYVDEVEDFYQKICRSKPFQSVKFNNEKNYQRLLRFALRKGENDLCAQLLVAEIMLLKKKLNKNEERRIFQIAVKLSKAKYTRGYNLLGRCYYEGIGTKKNINKVIGIYKKNGAKNDLLALYNLMSLDKKGFIDNIESATFKGYIPGTFNSYYLTNGLLKGEYKRAKKLFNRAAKK
ncbi:MAG: sel1 repeat family protein [Acholeplasmataceae bacterium]|nr:sel1 repeat family protein [Acholeplasmataceae bacterium]